MRILKCLLLAFSLLMPGLAFAQNDGRQERIAFGKGQSSATIKGAIKGRAYVDYLLQAAAGQTMSADFKTSNRSAYFNVMRPGADQALFNGSIEGNRFSAALPADGTYTLRVYLMRNAARRNEAANYTLTVGVAGSARADPANPAATPPAATAAEFDQTLELQGIKFRVVSVADGSAKKVRIVPQGLSIDNAPVEKAIDGAIQRAEVADMNNDGSPEIYVSIRSPGRGRPGGLVAYSANRKKSLSEIYLPPLADDKIASKGYQGGDEFAVGENALLHRFAIYDGSGPDAKPTGKTRQLQYKLRTGEAGWVLRVDKKTEY